MNFSNRIDDNAPTLLFESIQAVVDEIKGWRDNPILKSPPTNRLMPMPPDIYKDLSELADLIGESLEVVQELVVRGIYGRTQEGYYVCRIMPYRLLEAELRFLG